LYYCFILIISADVYCHMFITIRVILRDQVAGHRNSSKNSVHAAITERPGVQVLAFKATSSRENRQLIVNHLYSVCKLTLHYADSQSSSLWDNTSQRHLASLAAAVVPN